jgi:hypothetical protein
VADLTLKGRKSDINTNKCTSLGIDMMVWCGLDMAQDRDPWKALVNTVLTFEVHKMLESSLVAAQLVAPQNGLSSVSK